MLWLKSTQSTYSLNEAESAYLVYKWVGTNIEYDCYAYHHGGIENSGLGTYNKGKGVWAWYSSIFYTMWNSLGLEVKTVNGYAQDSSYVEGIVPKSTNHYYNVVKID